ncbi:MAG: Ig-like domain-containing protein [Candidatus Dojkabacteria bacterium]|nr:MAG: Ig-like domain-containing protein [Candidatus Dojkabacteria bacterium]
MTNNTTIFTKIGILAVLVWSLFSIQPVSANGTFRLDPTAGNFIRACQQSVAIMIDVTSGESNAADIILTYDTTKIDIIDALPGVPGTQILPGNAFESYSGNSVNTTTGEIKLVGYSGNETLTGEAVFATILFKSKPLAANGGFSFLFTGANPYNTLDSNIADATTSYDMLSGVTNASYTFSAGGCEADTTPPAITFDSPKNLANNVSPTAPVVVTVSDSGSGISLPSVTIVINGTVYTSTSPEVTYTGTPGNYQFTVLPAAPFPTNTLSVISVSATDNAGNKRNSNIVVNANLSCPVTQVSVPGSCPSVPPVAPPDNTSPVIEITSGTTLQLRSDNKIVIVATDQSGLSPESFVLSLGKLTFTLASTPELITVTGNKNNYVFTITLPESLLLQFEHNLVAGYAKISDLEGNTRIEQIVLQLPGLPSRPTAPKTMLEQFYETVLQPLTYYILPSLGALTLIYFGLLSTQPTIAQVQTSGGKAVRFPKGYLLLDTGSRITVRGGISGKLHGKVPHSAKALVIQKYGYHEQKLPISAEFRAQKEKPTVTLQKVS